MADLIIIVIFFFTALWACSSSSKHPKTRIDLTYSKEGLLSKLKELKEKLSSRADSYNILAEEIEEKRDSMANLNKSKKANYNGRLVWKNGFYNKTKELLTIVKYTIFLTVVSYLLHLTTDPKRDNLADVAFYGCSIALIMFTISLVSVYFTERKDMKKMSFKGFLNSQNEFYIEKISILEAKLNNEAESYQDIEDSIALIKAEIDKRENIDLSDTKIRIQAGKTFAAIKAKHEEDR